MSNLREDQLRRIALLTHDKFIKELTLRFLEQSDDYDINFLRKNELRLIVLSTHDKLTKELALSFLEESEGVAHDELSQTCWCDCLYDLRTEIKIRLNIGYMTTIVIGTTVVDYKTMEVDTPHFPSMTAFTTSIFQEKEWCFLVKNMMMVGVFSLELSNLAIVQQTGSLSFQHIENGWMKKVNDSLTYLFCWVVNWFTMKLMRLI